MKQIRLLDPNGYTVPGTVQTPVSEADADKARTHLLTEVAPEHAAQWTDFGYDPRDYRVTAAAMQIGPRTDQVQTKQQHSWTRRINGTWYAFLHVKESRTEPCLVVTREDADGWTDVHRFVA